jgi:hypothetical protein
MKRLTAVCKAAILVDPKAVVELAMLPDLSSTKTASIPGLSLKHCASGCVTLLISRLAAASDIDPGTK